VRREKKVKEIEKIKSISNKQNHNRRHVSHQQEKNTTMLAIT
jgi:hypothetical protein